MNSHDAPLAILAFLTALAFVVYRGPWRLYQGVRYWLRRRNHQPLRPNG